MTAEETAVTVGALGFGAALTMTITALLLGAHGTPALLLVSVAYALGAGLWLWDCVRIERTLSVWLMPQSALVLLAGALLTLAWFERIGS